jgi:hypothetical protein
MIYAMSITKVESKRSLRQEEENFSPRDSSPPSLSLDLLSHTFDLLAPSFDVVKIIADGGLLS